MIEREQEVRLRLAAALSRKFTPFQLAVLLKKYGSITQAMNVPAKDLCEIKGITSAKLKHLEETLNTDAIDHEREQCEKTNTSLLMLGDESYPPLLAKIDDPPALLWQRGEIIEDDYAAVAIVGSRNASYYGTEQASRFAREFGQRRITVVSGLARGIDTSAHRGALEGGGRTLAVIGSGLDMLYPPENVRLSQQIIEQGALLSEYPLSTPAHAKNFPQRNRIISGLCMATLVAQASKRSGSLITARLAGEQGREVFAIPGKIDTDDFAGCHALIKDGVQLVESLDDVLSQLHGLEQLAKEAPKKSPKPKFSGTTTELALVKLLKPSDPVNVEELISTSGLPAQQVGAALMTLEMRGAVKQLPGRNYVLGRYE